MQNCRVIKFLRGVYQLYYNEGVIYITCIIIISALSPCHLDSASLSQRPLLAKSAEKSKDQQLEKSFGIMFFKRSLGSERKTCSIIQKLCLSPLSSLLTYTHPALLFTFLLFLFLSLVYCCFFSCRRLVSHPKC